MPVESDQQEDAAEDGQPSPTFPLVMLCADLKRQRTDPSVTKRKRYSMPSGVLARSCTR
jgi:hypothetical protein